MHFLDPLLYFASFSAFIALFVSGLAAAVVLPVWIALELIRALFELAVFVWRIATGTPKTRPDPAYHLKRAGQ